MVAAAGVAGWVTVAAPGGGTGAAAVSATLVRDGEGSLWVASPDDRALVRLDEATLAERDRVDLSVAPHHVLVLADGRVVASTSGAGELVVVGTRGDATALEVPCASTAGMAELPGSTVRVAATCPVDDRVVVVDVDDDPGPDGSAPVASHDLPEEGRGPVAVAQVGDELLVLAERSSTVLTAPLRSGSGDGDDPDESLTGGFAVERPWSPPDRGTSALGALGVTGAGGDRAWVAAYQVIDNDTARDPTDPADTGSYGAVEDGEARIQPMVAGACTSPASDFSTAATRASGVHAVALDPDGRRVWVVGQYSGTVLVLDCGHDPEGPATVLAGFEVGVGATGIALSDDGGTAWVDLAFDHAVARLELPDDVTGDGVGGEGADLLAPAAVVAREVGPTSMSAQALRGRRIFHDATDPHLTPSGVVTCASCHPGGGEDGRTWRIGTLDIPSKLRRTPPLQGLAQDDEPLHADGGFDDLATLTVDTVRQLMGGDALLLDAAAVSAYLAELPAAPAPFEQDPSAAARGRELFGEEGFGCVACHSAGSGSDGRAHTVSPPVRDPDSLAGPVVTPRLVGLASRAPYLHDGRVGTLAELVRTHPGGGAPVPDDEQVADLVEYLRTL